MSFCANRRMCLSGSMDFKWFHAVGRDQYIPVMAPDNAGRCGQRDNRSETRVFSRFFRRFMSDFSLLSWFPHLRHASQASHSRRVQRNTVCGRATTSATRVPTTMTGLSRIQRTLLRRCSTALKTGVSASISAANCRRCSAERNSRRCFFSASSIWRDVILPPAASRDPASVQRGLPQTGAHADGHCGPQK